MTWYALHTSRDSVVASDLRAAGVPVYQPRQRLVSWSRQRSVTVSREVPLIPGYLLVGVSTVQPGLIRHWHEFLLDHASGRPLRVHDAERLISRCERGDFDVVMTRSRTYETLLIGDSVHVPLIEKVGVVESVLTHSARVRIGSTTVTVARSVLSRSS